MSSLKFDVLDMIREPDNYLPGEREKGAEAMADLIDAAVLIDHVYRHMDSDPHFKRLRAALSRLGGEA